LTRIQSATKMQLLKGAGYTYEFDHQIYVNRKDRKIFSIEFIEDQPPEVIENRIRADAPASDWSFFFNSPPSDSVKRELARVLN